MKILHVTYGIPPKNIGGMEIYSYNLAKQQRDKHTVYVLADFTSEDAKAVYNSSLDYKDINIICFKDKKPSGNIVRGAINRLRIFFGIKGYIGEVERTFLRIVHRMKPDVIHFHELNVMSPTVLKHLKAGGIKTVLTIHDFRYLCYTNVFYRYDGSLCDGPAPNYINCAECWLHGIAQPIRNTFQNIYRYIFCNGLAKKIIQCVISTTMLNVIARRRRENILRMLSYVDKLIAPSLFAERMFRKYAKFDNLIYSEYGIETKMLTNITHKKRTDKIVFGFAGSIIPIKGVDVLISAFNRVDGNKAKLLIYGRFDPKGNGYHKRLLSYVRNNSIKFEGEFHDPRNAYSNFDVLIVPSVWHDNCPLVILQAFAAGIPVIASRAGGMQTLIEDGINGLLFEPGNADELYNKIKMVIDNPALIEKFRQNIRPAKDIGENVEEMEKIYSDL